MSGWGPFECPQDRLRQGQGERVWEARVRWGVGDAMGDGDAPRRAPALGSRESGNDDGGCGGMRWREGFGSGWGPALAGGRFANRPYERGGAHKGEGDAGAAFVCPQHRLRRTDLGGARAVGSGGCDGGKETPRAAPLWIPAFAGMTLVGECGKEREVVCVGVGGPSTGSGRTDFGGARAVGVGDAMGGFFQVIEVLVVNKHYYAHKQKTPAPGVSTCEPKGRGGSRSIVGKILGSVKPSTSGGGILRLGRMWSPGPGRRPIRSPRWRRRGRGRCRR